LLKGKETPKDDAERIGLAYRAYEKALHLMMAVCFVAAMGIP
jgi:hypothetical protein